MLIFNYSCEEISSSTDFVKIATAGRHKGLSTLYIKHNLFHQSRLGRYFELQNTHLVLFKSPRDFLQINTRSQQLGLGSQLKDWYTKITSVPYGHLLCIVNLLGGQLQEIQKQDVIKYRDKIHQLVRKKPEKIKAGQFEVHEKE